MRRRVLLAGLGLVVGPSTLSAQFPPPSSPLQLPRTPPSFPQPARPATPLPLRPPSGSLPSPGVPGPSPGVPQSGVIPASGSIPAPVGATPGTMRFPDAPAMPGEPRPLPPALSPGQPVGPTPPVNPLALPEAVALPFPEEKIPIDSGSVVVKRVAGSWQVWAGPRVLRDLGDNEAGARDIVRAIRELRPTEWVSIGTPRPVVEYGLVNGKPPLVGGFPSAVLAVDMRSVRAEQVRGVWCLRDDANILFNFGLRRTDAEQAAAVIRKYGFNRVGTVGQPYPVMAYLFAALEAEGGRPAGAGVPVALQEAGLTRTGIPIPGVGFVGEMMKIDPQRVEARKEKSEWVVAFGPEVLGRLGPTEWAANDARRVIRDGQFTEFCRFGSAGLTFFLVDGKAPTRVPFAAQGRQFDPTALRVQVIAGTRWTVTEAGRPLFDVSGPDEGEALIRLLRHFQFDQLCQVGPTPKMSLTFLARSR